MITTTTIEIDGEPAILVANYWMGEDLYSLRDDLVLRETRRAFPSGDWYEVVAGGWHDITEEQRAQLLHTGRLDVGNYTFYLKE